MTFGKGKIWMNGKLVPWRDAKTHVLAHVVHYGSSVFDSVRCYPIGKQVAVFRLADHVRRFFDSAKIHHMDIPYSTKGFTKAVCDTVRTNKLKGCYIRLFAFRDYGPMGLYPLNNPLSVSIAAWDWGQYLGPESMTKGVSVKVSSWRRPAPDTHPTMSKAGGNYQNSQLMKVEAIQDGYDEAIALDTAGFISEGSGENVFLVRDNILYTPHIASSILPGIRRQTIISLAREMGLEVIERALPREFLTIADEIFLTGTATEIVPVTKVDKASVGNGKRGPLTKRIQEGLFAITHGTADDRFGWLTYI